MIGFSIISIIIGLAVFGIPMVFGMIQCTKYIFNGPSQVSIIDAYTQQYESILDVSDQHAIVQPFVKRRSYAEIISMGIAPVVGVIISFVFSDMKVPFDPLYSLSAVTFITIGYLSYWISRKYRAQLPLKVNLILPYGILIGIVCYIILFIHFISFTTVIALTFASLITFPLIAPLPATLYAIRQFQIHRAFVKKKIKKEEESGNFLDQWTSFLAHNNSANPIVLTACIIIILGFLFLLGQPLDGFWQAFRGSEGFLFSIKEFNF